VIVKSKSYNWHLKPNDLFLYASMDVEAVDGTKSHIECSFPPTIVISIEAEDGTKSHDAWKVFGLEDFPDYVDRKDIPKKVWKQWGTRRTKVVIEKYQYEKEKVIVEKFHKRSKLTDEQIMEVLKMIPA
jgi:hypothetical protein